MNDNYFSERNPKTSVAISELDAAVLDLNRISTALTALGVDTVQNRDTQMDMSDALGSLSDAIATLDEAAYELSQEKQS